MAEYPPTVAERAALRANLRTRALAAAEQAAAVAGLSLNCERRLQLGTHPDDAPGCANDGTGCLCACHDQGGDDRG